MRLKQQLIRICGGMLLSTSLFANEVTLNVPLDLRGFPPEVETVHISCSLLTSRETIAANAPDVIVPLSAGAYSGEVRLIFARINPSVAVDVSSYLCGINQANLRRTGPPGTGSIAASVTGGIYSSSTIIPAQAGTTPVARVQGPIRLTPRP